MSISGGGWVPQLPANLQTQLSNLENGQTSYVSSYVGKAASALYTQTVSEAMPLVMEQANLNSEVTNLNSLKTALTTLQTAIQTLGTQSTWNAVAATSSNTNTFTITASAGAPQTSTSITVNQLAQGQISMLTGVTPNTPTDPSSASNAQQGTLTISGLAQATVNVSAGDSLNTIAANINDTAATTGVQASVVDNTGTYQIMLTSNQTGATKGAFTFNGGTTGIAMSSTNVQNPLDAQITIGGSGGVSLTSSTNTFTNALPNTTINVVSAGTGTVTIKSDPSSVTNAVQSLFDAYNGIEKLVYTGGSAADTTIGQLIAGQLPGVAGEAVTTDTKFQALSEIGALISPGSYSESNGSFSSSSSPSMGWESSSGITGVSLPSGVTLPDGKTTFNNAMTNNLADLQKFFGVTTAGLNLPSGSFLSNLNSSVSTWLTDLNGGSVNGSTITGEITTVQNQIGASGNSALPGTISYSLNQLNQQYKNQVQSLISQWSAAQASIIQANSQMTMLQAEMQLTQSQSFQTGMMLGG